MMSTHENGISAGTSRRPTAQLPGPVIVHQLDADGICWREFTYHPAADAATEALYERISRGYLMSVTMVTRDGVQQLGATGSHAGDPATAGSTVERHA